jgi:hypothetical protein
MSLTSLLCPGVRFFVVFLLLLQLNPVGYLHVKLQFDDVKICSDPQLPPGSPDTTRSSVAVKTRGSRRHHGTKSSRA